MLPRMRFAPLAAILWSSLLFAGSPEQQMNVNTRYTVESVEVAGDNQAISGSLRSELTRLVGEKLNPAALDDLAARMRRELHVRAVTHHLLRGQTPEHVRVVFDVRGLPAKFEASVPKLVYRTDAGFSGLLAGTATVGWQALTFGVVSDGDDLAERYSGVVARYEDKHLGSDRVSFRLDFSSYHEQWNGATVTALQQPTAENDTSWTYRSRDNIEPLVTFVLLKGTPGLMDLTLGTSFERLQPEFAAARPESANAMVTTLRYHRRLEGSGANQQQWDAGYSLRAATNLLGSDFAYARHQGDVGYVYSWGHSQIQDSLTAGVITGRAPLFERFMLGNSTLLRGWNRFDLDPLGGDRMVHNSVEYRYRLLDIFYDSGAIWDQGQAAVLRHAAGVGIRQNGLYAALAFPIKEGHIEPIFMVGMNY
ncbi:MAG TPA: BamA/TamA family outer membrane protein [Bryobacteraceae bacterium]|nr:BamA/TamA family outer membrane protein [Bryobacteraceae bacterium]